MTRIHVTRNFQLVSSEERPIFYKSYASLERQLREENWPRGVFYEPDPTDPDKWQVVKVNNMRRRVRDVVYYELEDEALFAARSLFAAITNDDVELVQSLVGRADVNVRSICRTTPLIEACFLSKLPVVRALIVAGADVNVHNDDGDFPLSAAVENGKLEIVQVLIAAGANITIRDTARNTLLHVAAIRNLLEIVECLLDAGIYSEAPNEAGYTAEDEARRNGYMQVADWLKNYRMGPDIKEPDRE